MKVIFILTKTMYGLKLVKSMVKIDLKGEMLIDTKKTTKITIRWKS